MTELSLVGRRSESCATVSQSSGGIDRQVENAAEIAMEPLAAYSAGKISWAEVRQVIARNCDERFARRLVWAGWLQRLMFKPCLQTPLVLFAPRWQLVWQSLLARTR